MLPWIRISFNKTLCGKCCCGDYSHETMKKRSESPCRPMVPGPDMSARTLTIEKAPPMMPKPRPATAIKAQSSYSQYTSCSST